MPIDLPRLIPVHQRFAQIPSLDVRATIESQLDAKLGDGRVPRDARIAVAVGSRGIANLSEIVASVVEWLRRRGAKPFIVPAMGSHGGATPEGQAEVLAGYGITEAALGLPIRASMEVRPLGRTGDGVEVYFSAEALAADGIVVINRVKPHTDFAGRIGSGILKMTAIGLGKHVGASTVHAAAMSFGFEHAIRTVARRIFEQAPMLAGVAILEGPRHETVKIEILNLAEIERREEELLATAASLMPKLPFDEIDLLIVERMGKNISGTGMDPNVIGRGVHGYSTRFSEQQASRSLGPRQVPVIRRIFVRELTPETHGNAIGIGLADFTTRRLVEAMDRHFTSINVLTSLSLHLAKIPMYFDTDREAIEHALVSTCRPDTAGSRVVRIADTLSLENMEVSEAYCSEFGQKTMIEPLGAARDMVFDESGNLMPL
jgi:hypothetical protein